MYAQGHSQKVIAAAIGRDKSVISRELKRNRNEKGKYVFKDAQQLADIRKERLRRPRVLTEAVRKRIDQHLREDQWSPEQIAGRCKAEGIPMVGTTRIYEYIREDKAQGGDLYKHCRHRLKHRKRPVGRAPIQARRPIEARPACADGTRFGDWEMDLIVGKDHCGAMLTLVERSTGFTRIRPLPRGRNAEDVAEAAFYALVPFKQHVLTITTDNGPEFAAHKRLEELLDTRIYFAHPYCSWEKGLIEYTNKLYRQYIPKNSRFSDFTREQIEQIQDKLNARPRRKLGYKKPSEVFYSALQSQQPQLHLRVQSTLG